MPDLPPPAALDLARDLAADLAFVASGGGGTHGDRCRFWTDPQDECDCGCTEMRQIATAALLRAADAERRLADKEHLMRAMDSLVLRLRAERDRYRAALETILFHLTDGGRGNLGDATVIARAALEAKEPIRA